MATSDVTAKNSRATDWADDFSLASVEIMDGATVLATHTLAGFGAATSGQVSANAIPDATVSNSGTADSVVISSVAGTYTLTVGLSGSGADVIIDDLNFVQGGISKLNSLIVSFS